MTLEQWKAVAELAMAQRDEANKNLSNMQIDLAMAHRRNADLEAKLADLAPSDAPQAQEITAESDGG